MGIRSIGIDFETTKKPILHPWQKGAYAVMFGVAYEDGTRKTWVINHDEVPNVDQRKVLTEIQHEIDAAGRLVGHNIKFDLNWLRHFGIDFSHCKIFCTMVTEYLLMNQRALGKLSLGQVSERYLKSPKHDKVKIFWDAGVETSAIPLRYLRPYLEQDCVNTLAIYQYQKARVMRRGLGMPQLVKVQCEASRVFSEMECNGMKFNKEVAVAAAKDLRKQVADTDAQLFDIFEFDCNISSGDDLSAALFGGVIKRKGKEYYPRKLKAYLTAKDMCPLEYKSRNCIIETKIDGLGFKPDQNTALKKEGYFATDKGAIKHLAAKTKKQKLTKQLLIERSSMAKALESLVGKGDQTETGLINKVQADGHLHSQFNQCIAKTGRTSSSDPNCFSADTEVLTDRGWILWPDLTKEQLVAQYDIKTQEISFTKPLAYIKEWCDVPLQHIITEKQIDLLITGKHNCLYRDRKTNIIRVRPAIEYPKDAQQIQAGYYKTGGLTEPKAKLILIVAYQADGHRRKQDGIVEFTFSKARKIARLRQALRLMQIPFKEHLKKANQVRFTVSRKNIPIWFSKRLKINYLLTLSEESFQFFAKELFFWDGCYKRQSMYSSNIKQNTDTAQIMQILSGRRAKVREYTTCIGNANWQIDVTKQDYSLTANHVRKKVLYSDFVYCVTMPKGTVIIRRNGRVAITKNSQNLPRKGTSPIKEAIEPEFDYIIAADLSQIEWRGAAFLSQDPIMCDEIRSGFDPHDDNTINMFKVQRDSPDWDETRTTAKIFSFRMIYGGSAFGFYMDNKMPNFSMAKWADIVEAFYDKYQGLQRWQQANISKVYQNKGLLQSVTGRIYEFHMDAKGYRKPQICNFPVQGLATADIMMLAMCIIWKKYKAAGFKSKLINQVHDSLIFDALRDEVKPISRLCIDVFEALPMYIEKMWGFKFNLPLTGDVECGKNYLKMVKIKNF